MAERRLDPGYPDSGAQAAELHCCADMRREAGRQCDQHSDRFECGDCLVHYSPALREYGLIVHDGGTSSVAIRFCPWCGSALPESLRDRWFAELERRGVDPWSGEIPEEFRSAAWWSIKSAEPGAAPDRGGTTASQG